MDKHELVKGDAEEARRAIRDSHRARDIPRFLAVGTSRSHFPFLGSLLFLSSLTICFLHGGLNETAAREITSLASCAREKNTITRKTRLYFLRLPPVLLRECASTPCFFAHKAEVTFYVDVPAASDCNDSRSNIPATGKRGSENSVFCEIHRNYTLRSYPALARVYLSRDVKDRVTYRSTSIGRLRLPRHALVRLTHASSRGRRAFAARHV